MLNLRWNTNLKLLTQNFFIDFKTFFIFLFQLERQIIANMEQTNDYQETIRKFRELVQQLQVSGLKGAALFYFL